MKSNLLIRIILFTMAGLVSCLDDTFEPFYFGSLSGYVYDNFNDEPLYGVEINTNPSSSVVYTDSAGFFEIHEIESGDYSFTALVNGYEKAFVNATILSGITTEITFKLDRKTTFPETPNSPFPGNGENNLSRDLSLTWICQAAKNDSLTFDISVYESNIDTAVFEKINTSDTFLVLNDLRYETTYFWQVKAKSATGGESNGPVWSFSTLDFPDNRFLYSRAINGNYQVYSTNEDSEQDIQITRNSFNSLNPRYNNNRTEIAYTSNFDLDYQIHIMSYKGANARQITTLPIAGYHNNGTGYAWWPDNGGFIYPYYDKLLSIDRNGSNLVEITTAPPGRHFKSCDISSDGNTIVALTSSPLIYEGEILMMDRNGQNVVQLVPDYPGIIQNPSLSVDGKLLMYTRDASGYESPDGRMLDSRIYILNLDNMETTDVSFNKPAGTNDIQPRFSPFGSEIIFVNVLNDGSGTKSVFKMNLSGGDRGLLFNNGEMPDWR